MPKQIRRLKLREVSLVDKPANIGARVMLYKAQDPAGMVPDGNTEKIEMADETQDVAADQIAELTNQVGDLTAANADLGKKNAEIEKQLKDAVAKVEKLEKQAAEAAADDGEDPILKGLSPAARQRFEDLEKQATAHAEELAKINEARETDAAITKIAKEFSSLPVKPENFGPVYRKLVKALKPDELKMLDGVLSAQAAVTKLTTEIGRSTHGEATAAGEAEAMIMAKAEEIRKANPKMTAAQARVQAVELNPDLYTRYRQEVF